MADFVFYTQEYLGSKIPERAFPGALSQARAALSRLRRIYQVAQATAVEENMALCAMAEAIYEFDKAGNVASATVGSVSVRYLSGEDAQRRLGRELYRRACIYLDIRRGVR